MKHSLGGQWRWAALVVAGCLSIATACSEPDITNRRDVGAERVRDPIDGAAALRRLRALPQDWVGRAHNGTLETMRAEMSQPGVLTRNLCRYTADLVAKSQHVPIGMRGNLAQVITQATRAGFDVTTLCRPRAQVHPSVLPAVRAPQGSADANALVQQIQLSADAAVDLYDLAARLEPVAAAAAALDAFEHEAVLATISVALHSYEYWSTHLDPFTRVWVADFGPCASDYADRGYTEAGARQACLNDELTDDASMLVPLSDQPSLRLASASAQYNECSLSIRFKRLLGKDIAGAFGGAMATIFTGHGVIVGAFAGGVAASASEFLEGTWILFWCAMRGGR